MTKLTPGTQAPALDVETLDGGRWRLAEQTPRNYTMVVFYRGLHCPVCKGFIGELDSLVGDFADAGVEVIAVSMDPKDRAEQSKRDWGLDNVRIGYGLSEAQARDWGLYISESIKEAENDVFAEPGLFLIDGDGRLYLINISNMPWARPAIAELPAKIKFALENKYPVRGTKA